MVKTLPDSENIKLINTDAGSLHKQEFFFFPDVYHVYIYIIYILPPLSTFHDQTFGSPLSTSWDKLIGIIDPRKLLNSIPVNTAVCSSPQAISTIMSFLIQNFEGALSANLLFPNVNTAPVSGGVINALKCKSNFRGTKCHHLIFYKINHSLLKIKRWSSKTHFLGLFDIFAETSRGPEYLVSTIFQRI